MFCGCPVEDQAAPNGNICPICTGQPGALPVPNKEAIEMGVKTGLALKCMIAPFSKFDRKHYFYPDLPKAYQISQFDLPIAEKGSFTFEVNGEERTVSITRAHLEEDAAKNVHGTDGKTYVDFNRACVPLLEIVTGPDFRSPEEAKAFLQELRLTLRYLGVSNADMEKGQMRCDANISLRVLDENGNTVGAEFNPKTEVKNLNSFRHVERALAYEIAYQKNLWETGTPPMISTTRGWDDAAQATKEQRTKESAEDYRFFPEPDIPPLELAELTKELSTRLPELPAARRTRFRDEYALKAEDARQLCDDPALSEFTENVFSELAAWIRSSEANVEKEKLARLVSTWILTKLLGCLAERGDDVRIMKVNPENFAELMMLLATNKLNAASGLTVLNTMLEDGSDPSHVMEEKGLGKLQDAGLIAEAVDRVLAANPAEVERYRAGDKKLLPFFIGKVMKETEGTADAAETRNMLLVKLETV